MSDNILLNTSREVLHNLQALIAHGEALNQKISHADERLREIEDYVNTATYELYSSLDNVKDELLANYNEVKGEMESLVNMVQSDLNVRLTEGFTLMDNAQNEAAESLMAATTSASETSESFMQWLSTSQAALDGLHSAFDTSEQTVDTRFAETQATIEQIKAQILENRAHWHEQTQQVVSEISNRQTAVDQHMDEDVYALVTQGYENYGQKINTLAASGVNDPLAMLSQSGQGIMNQGVNQVFDTALDEITNLIDTLIDELLSSRDRNSGEREALSGIVDGLQSLIEPLLSQIDAVKEIASTVGIDLE